MSSWRNSPPRRGEGVDPAGRDQEERFLVSFVNWHETPHLDVSEQDLAFTGAFEASVYAPGLGAWRVEGTRAPLKTYENAALLDLALLLDFESVLDDYVEARRRGGPTSLDVSVDELLFLRDGLRLHRDLVLTWVRIVGHLWHMARSRLGSDPRTNGGRG